MTRKRNSTEVEAVQALLRSIPEGKALLDPVAAKPAVGTADMRQWGAHRLYDPLELNRLLLESKSGPRDAYDIMSKYLHAAQSIGPWRKLAPAPAPNSLAPMAERFPNFVEIVADLEKALALAQFSRDKTLSATPLLLLGDPGIGKTRFAKECARRMGVPYLEISMNTTTASFVLSGTDLSWGNGRPGQLFKTLSTCEMANLVILVDELDKVSSDRRYDPLAPLLTLLESATSRTFRDEAIPLALDASRILWFATANSLDAVSEPIRSRFQIRHVQPPNREQNLLVADSVWADLRQSQPWGAQFDERLQDAVVMLLATLTPRAMQSVLLNAAGSAALAGRHHIEAHDLRFAQPAYRSIGFVQ